MTPPIFLPTREAFSGSTAQQKSPIRLRRAFIQSDQNKFPEAYALGICSKLAEYNTEY